MTRVTLRLQVGTRRDDLTQDKDEGRRLQVGRYGYTLSRRRDTILKGEMTG